VHAAYRDAEAYAKWAGKELPSEAEWEFAARGGLDRVSYAWGDELYKSGHHMANTWQGEFPWQNLRSDGYERTSPVGSFPPNGYGLVDVCGNVWEWTTSGFTLDHGQSASRAAREPSRAPCCGPPAAARPSDVRLVIKGGSHLCAPNYCLRYRPAARQPQAIDTSMAHLGFRCVVRDHPGGDDASS